VNEARTAITHNSNVSNITWDKQRCTILDLKLLIEGYAISDDESLKLSWEFLSLQVNVK
jgi:hypothetical protein